MDAGLTPPPVSLRASIECAIAGLIDLLDAMDGDVDLEPEIDTAADDAGEPEGETWLMRA
jgi:hypothetical protein